MKKLVASLFLFVFLFNVGGYYIVFWGLHHQAHKALLERLDNDQYSAEETITIKIPLTLPYPIYKNGFQRVNGDFKYNGEFYKLVKQNLAGDTLHVVCIKDEKAKTLENAWVDYAKLSNDIPASEKQPLNILSKLLKDFTANKLLQIVHASGWSQLTAFNQPSFEPVERTSEIPGPPPKKQLS